MSQQLSHRTTSFPIREFPLVVICDAVSGPANIGSLFRICDAFGVARIIFTGAQLNMRSGRMRKTSRDTYKSVKWTQADDVVSTIKQYQGDGYYILGLEITSSSLELTKLDWDRERKTALLVGNEQRGISEPGLELCDQVAHLELYGVNSSINVSHAAAIALYHLTHFKACP